MILPLSSALVRPHMECTLGPQYKRGMDIVEKVQWRVTKVMKGQEPLSYKQRLGKELGPFSLKK